MYILYCDISGNSGRDEDSHLVLGGVAAKEDALYHVMRELDDLVLQSPLSLPPEIELHGNEIYAGRKLWRRIDRPSRVDFLKQCLGVLSGPSRQNLTCFGIVVEKSRVDGDPVLFAYEQVVNRFNAFLSRTYEINRRKYNARKHRGLVVFDDSRYEQDLQGVAQEYRVNGTRWGKLPFLAEVPLFSDSKASRLIQLADLVAYGLFRRFERDDSSLLSTYASCFDRHNHRTHGLYHFTSDDACPCPSCTNT